MTNHHHSFFQIKVLFRGYYSIWSFSVGTIQYAFFTFDSFPCEVVKRVLWEPDTIIPTILAPQCDLCGLFRCHLCLSSHPTDRFFSAAGRFDAVAFLYPFTGVLVC
jgi:hypothetical protein